MCNLSLSLKTWLVSAKVLLFFHANSSLAHLHQEQSMQSKKTKDSKTCFHLLFPVHCKKATDQALHKQRASFSLSFSLSLSSLNISYRLSVQQVYPRERETHYEAKGGGSWGWEIEDEQRKMKPAKNAHTLRLEVRVSATLVLASASFV